MKQIIKIVSVVLVSTFIMISCDLTEPFSLPSWETKLKVFLSQEEITLEEILNESDLETEFAYGDSVYFFLNKTQPKKRV